MKRTIFMIFIKICPAFAVLAVFCCAVLPMFAAGGDDIRLSRPRDVRAEFRSSVFEGDEDEVPIPFAATVYLLPESAVEILKRKNFTPTDENGNLLTGEQAYLDAVANTLGQKDDENDDENALLAFLIAEAMEENKILKLRTGENGQTTATIAGGSYYLFAAERVDGELFVWHFPVELFFSGGAPIELDQHNAAAVIAVE
jgi:hypothetical protein